MVFNFFGSFFVALALAVTIQSKIFNNTIYIISNAETPSLNQQGLTPIGARRAHECLPQLFEPLDIGIILTCPFDRDSKKCNHTVATASPIAQSLGLPLITKCGAGEESDDDCVSNTLKAFAKNSTQSMLVVWDLGDMDSLFENINVDYDDDESDDDDVSHFDLLFTVVKQKAGKPKSQNCTGIDGPEPGTL